MSKAKVALGVLIGAITGFFAGIITAPKSGAETRADIKAKAESIKADISKKAGIAVDEAGEVVENIKGKAGDLKDRAEQVVEDVKDKAGELRDRTEHAVEGAKKGFFKNR